MKTKATKMTNQELTEKGLRALEESLGPVGMIRFIQQFDTGSGNYTEERSIWLDHYSIDSISEEIKKARNK